MASEHGTQKCILIVVIIINIDNINISEKNKNIHEMDKTAEIVKPFCVTVPFKTRQSFDDICL